MSVLLRRRRQDAAGRNSRDDRSGRQTHHPRNERRDHVHLPHRGRRRLSIDEAKARRWVRNRQRWINFCVAGAVGVAVFFAVGHWLHGATHIVAAYDAFGLTLLTLFWRLGLHADPELTKARAALDDPGKNVVAFVVSGAVVAGLVSAIAILGHGPQASTGVEKWIAYLLAAIAVSEGWFLVQTLYTFRYAHLYWYDEDGDGLESGGITFPGTKNPSDYDFAYFAFTLGTSFAISDPQITETRIRREVIVHAIIAFWYNSIIIGMVINIFAGIFSTSSGK